MNGNSTVSQKPTSVQLIAVVSVGIMAITLTFAVTWCAVFKIYIDAPMLMLISALLGGIAGSLTTILVGRSISQLNQPDEPIQTTITQPLGKPVPVVESPATPPESGKP
jgi:hypothetical protein